jgi:two-component system OmpR family response regulator
MVVLGDTTIDTAARMVYREGRPVSLTVKEFAILEYLARRRGTLVTRSVLCDHLYNEDSDVFSNVVDVHVAALRRKLGRDLIQTRRGHGYIIDV